MSIFRWIFAVAVVGLIGMAAMQGLKPRMKPPTTVHTVKATRASLTRTVSGAGKLEPARKVNVSAQITGTLLDLKVVVGSEVKKGDYLGQIDTSSYTAQVAQGRATMASARSAVERARARLGRLKRELERIEALEAKGAAGSAELDAAVGAVREGEADVIAGENLVRQAQAGLDEANKRIQLARLEAPVDGTVLSVNHRVGERMRGSDFSEDVVLVIGSVAEMEVKIEVGEHDVVHLKPGQKAVIEIDALPDHPLVGHVRDSARDAIIKNPGTDNEVTTFTVWIGLDEPPPVALSGMSAHVDIATDTRDGAIAVPIQAVTVRAPDKDKPAAPPPTPAGKTDAPGGNPAPASAVAPAADPGLKKLQKVVFVVKDGKVEQRRVQTGLASETMIEITDGLAEGDEVVEGPYRVLARQLHDGDEVVVEAGPGSGGGAEGKR